MSEEKHELPAIQDLYEGVEKAFKNDKLNLLLQQPPPDAWVKKHPMLKNEYLPIEKIEFLLTRIFQKWRAEIIHYGVLFQSISVHVRLHYFNPVSQEWESQDGVGAWPIQTDKGKNAADLGAIKNSAVQQALPAAESAAIKDAAHKLGKLFGGNLNRKNGVDFSRMFEEGETEEVPDGVKDAEEEHNMEAAKDAEREVGTYAKETEPIILPKSEDL